MLTEYITALATAAPVTTGAPTTTGAPAAVNATSHTIVQSASGIDPNGGTTTQRKREPDAAQRSDSQRL